MKSSIALAGVPGPVRVSADGRHFVDRSGAPFFWLGDTAWPLFTQYSKEQAEAYFEHVDHLVDYADRQGLVLAMLPTWGYYVKEARVLNATNARAYGRWLGARYKDAPNVVWVNGGDRTPTGFEDVFRELARAGDAQPRRAARAATGRLCAQVVGIAEPRTLDAGVRSVCERRLGLVRASARLSGWPADDELPQLVLVDCVRSSASQHHQTR